MAWLKWAEDKLTKFSRVTHVANAYTEDILVKVLADAMYLDRYVDVNVGNYGIKNGQNIWEKCNKDGFTIISPGNFIKFSPDTSSSGNVYITIVTKSGEVICDCLPKSVNESVIVAKDGRVRDTQMGTIWTDASGYVHN